MKIVVQWGIITLTVNSWTYSFPIAFNTACVSAHTTDCGSNTYALGFNAISKTQFTIYRDKGGTDNVVFFWLAIGY